MYTDFDREDNHVANDVATEHARGELRRKVSRA
jgi:hypothetical protein